MTPPMDNTDLEAGKLSPAQRRLMLGDTSYTKWATYEKLIKLGLMEQVGGFVTLTPLGSRLRSHLKGYDHGS